MTTERIAVVTGASRGAGKGIALALAQPGTTVYVTGRTVEPGRADLPGTIGETADEITRRGGTGIAVAVDHSDDDQADALFDQVRADHGRLDILVNNATALPAGLTEKGPFWNKGLGLLDLHGVGLRSTYVSTYYAAPLLIETGGGLVVHTSSFGGTCYMHGPAYGSGKAAVDKMAHDMAVDFTPFDVAVVSLYMGLLKTERTLTAFEANPQMYAGLAATAETVEFPGRIIDALSRDPKRMERSGQILIGAELATELGVTDVDGNQPPSHRRFLGDPPTFSAAVVE
ncbi:SDR family NAD(P)-dependent oxidoreductase [Gordonia hydrophobica]|uniref:SDR family NAD(P)-dependent oxidoreductase n=1 Tax=Gordonia hydrophobica TaxID=40516 RepID=A0ABZ2U3X7_9ACTN|nr:SDR family NAD(P)-dependent oxidoreductase [Gordonia hydrophobica]MBM7367860.1 NAD(P)-dependent dehydrogenase (short-subunit alcohol dehydrogenase family) [Gordonia hydrophobica]